MTPDAEEKSIGFYNIKKWFVEVLGENMRLRNLIKKNKSNLRVGTGAFVLNRS